MGCGTSKDRARSKKQRSRPSSAEATPEARELLDSQWSLQSAAPPRTNRPRSGSASTLPLRSILRTRAVSEVGESPPTRPGSSSQRYDRDDVVSIATSRQSSMLRSGEDLTPEQRARALAALQAYASTLAASRRQQRATGGQLSRLGVSSSQSVRQASISSQSTLRAGAGSQRAGAGSQRVGAGSQRAGAGSQRAGAGSQREISPPNSRSRQPGSPPASRSRQQGSVDQGNLRSQSYTRRVSFDEDTIVSGVFDSPRQTQESQKSSAGERQRAEALALSQQQYRTARSVEEDQKRAEALRDASRQRQRVEIPPTGERQRAEASQDFSQQRPRVGIAPTHERQNAEALQDFNRQIGRVQTSHREGRHPIEAVILSKQQPLVYLSSDTGPPRVESPFGRASQTQGPPTPPQQALSGPSSFQGTSRNTEYLHAPGCRCKLCAPGFYVNGVLREAWYGLCTQGCLCPICMSTHSIPRAPHVHADHKLPQDQWCENPNCACRIGCLNTVCTRCYQGGAAKARSSKPEKKSCRRPTAGSSSGSSGKTIKRSSRKVADNFDVFA
jgi:hypothetical protein